MQEKLTEQSVTRLVVFTYVMVGMTALQLYLMYVVRELVIPMSKDLASEKTCLSPRTEKFRSLRSIS